MPEHYTGLGITVMYPDNWKVEDETEQSVTIESPGGSFLNITRFDKSALQLEDGQESQLLVEAAEAMKAEYEIIEQEEREINVAGIQMPQIVQRFPFLDLIVVANMSLLTIDDATFLIQTQGEDREMEQLDAVFQAMIVSLYQSIQDDVTK